MSQQPQHLATNPSHAARQAAIAWQGVVVAGEKTRAAARSQLFGALLVLCLGGLGAGCAAPADDGQASPADAGVSFNIDTASLPTNDAGVAADSAGAAAQECPGGPGCTCAENADCDTAMCISTPNGKQCAQKCIDSCPQGFMCSPVSGAGGDTWTMCVPRWGRLCDPCKSTKQCEALGMQGSVCVDRAADGSFCGVACNKDAECPESYGCEDVKSVDGVSSKQCVPKAGVDGAAAVCSCSKRAASLALSTVCHVAITDDAGETIGTCAGERFCGADGLTTCTAPAPADESCDGIDNDCDGKTDEATCDDDNECTQDACNPKDANDSDSGDDKCSHTQLQTPCDADGSLCTVNDQCVAGACVAGKAKNCDDSNPCTADTCLAATGCVQKPDNGAPCDDDNPCTIGDLCAASACVGGNAKPCTTNSSCVTSKCDLTTGKCGYKQKKDGQGCDDGDTCTHGDACEDGDCAGATKSCDDNNPCTNDVCKAKSGSCTHLANGGACTDGDACTVGDVCDTAKGACVSGKTKACDDDNPCTTDACDTKTGTCASQSKAGPCNDGDACTHGDACLGGACKSGLKKACDDANPCTADACNPLNSACVHVATAAKCDDGDACTVKDACALGACKAGLTKVCNDGDGCTTDTCNGTTGACVHKSINGCGGNCAKTSDCNDDNPCTFNLCAKGKCAFPVANATCEDGNNCTLGDICSNGACAAGKAKSCDDGNPCTADTCNTKTGACSHSGVSGPCDDGNPCTLGDVCNPVKATCAAGKPKSCNDNNVCTADKCDSLNGNCVLQPKAGPCNDGDACTLADSCSNGKCVGLANACDDNNVCTKGGCDKATGGCVQSPVPGLCDDGNACTLIDRCTGKSKHCKAGPAKSCDDVNPCTQDACKPQDGGCTHVAKLSVCNDGDPCTVADKCVAGQCAVGPAKACEDGDTCSTDSCDSKTGKCGHTPIVGCGGNCAKAADCGDGNPCTADVCINGKCAFPTNQAACDDGDPCSVGDLCQAGKCKAQAVKQCSDANPCTVDSCDGKSGKCLHTGTSAPCTDNQPCTIGDTCDPKSGACKSGSAKVCADKFSCTNDACDPATGSCVFSARTGTCEDGHGCTVADTCVAGACKPGPHKDCDDGQSCTVDSCDKATGKCVFSPAVGSCNDVNPCTLLDQCSGGSCVPGKLKSCDDANPCTNDTCNTANGKCAHVANSAKCDDNNACTAADTCGFGQCTAGSAKNCSDGDACTSDGCNTKTGACVFVPIVGCGGNCAKVSDCDDANPCTTNLCSAGKCAFKANVAACSDGNACSINDVCKGGNCIAGQAKPCNDGNACTDDACDPKSGSCTTSANTAKCDDSNACTTSDSCAKGSCVAGPKKGCDDGQPCTDDVCDPSQGACVFVSNSAKCSDNNACTASDACVLGKCKPGQAKACNDGNPCTHDSCNPSNAVCVHTANTSPCDDGTACTIADTCNKGSCVAGTARNCDDGNPCTADTCAMKTGQCSSAANAQGCNDGNACTISDTCKGGACVSGAAKSCDDNDGCTKDACNPSTGGCSNAPIIGCGGNCSKVTDCDDANACTTNLCSSGKCAFTGKTGAACTDNNPCTVDDVCQYGTCVKGAAKLCDDSNNCTTDSCSLATGKCLFTNNVAPCADGDVCTYGATCAAGKCQGGKPRNCDDVNTCTSDSCNPNSGACEHAPMLGGTKCEDGNSCTINDYCTKGHCASGKDDCGTWDKMALRDHDVDDKGRVVIVGNEFKKPHPYVRHVWAKCFKQDTHTLRGEWLLAKTVYLEQYFQVQPVVRRSDKSGYSVVGWHEMLLFNGGWRNQFALLDANCEVVAGPFVVDGFAKNVLKRPARYGIDDTGRSVVMQADQTANKLRASSFANSGKLIAAADIATPLGYQLFDYAHMAMDPVTGGYIVAAVTKGSGTNKHVVNIKRFSIDHKPQAAQWTVLPYLQGIGTTKPLIAIDRNGLMMVGIEEDNNQVKLGLYGATNATVKEWTIDAKYGHIDQLVALADGFVARFPEYNQIGLHRYDGGTGKLLKAVKPTNSIRFDAKHVSYRLGYSKFIRGDIDIN